MREIVEDRVIDGHHVIVAALGYNPVARAHRYSIRVYDGVTIIRRTTVTSLSYVDQTVKEILRHWKGTVR